MGWRLLVGRTTLAAMQRVLLIWLSVVSLIWTGTALASEPVKLASSSDFCVLKNGILTAQIEKRSGVLVSLKCRGLEMLAVGRRGSDGGYWSSVGRSRPGGQAEGVVRTDPSSNQGSRGEISCQLRSKGGANSSPVDVDYRYSLARGEHWLYVYSVLVHKPGYPPFSVGEARYCVKLNPEVFDYLAVDEARRDLLPSGADWDAGEQLNVKEARRMTTGRLKGKAEHKYSYSAVLTQTPAYGWSSTKHNVGLWLINPSMEYVSGGPTKVELTGHLDVNPGGLPTLLNMWVGSHYGGSSLSVGTDENWAKVVGPFLLYCNTNGAPTTGDLRAQQEPLRRDALARAGVEAAAWPYSWVDELHYPLASGRGIVRGRIQLQEPQAPSQNLTNLWVGLTAPDYVPPRLGFGLGGGLGGTNRFGRSGRTNAPSAGPGGFARSFFFRGGFPPAVDWQRDAMYYQYWAKAATDGTFAIPNARPGSYVLRAIAANVLGEFALSNVVVTAGDTENVGTLKWVPERFGRMLWEIGLPDRTAREFRHGDDYWHWATFLLYSREYPKDLEFVIGKSDWRKDWNYVQPPRFIEPIDRDKAGSAEMRLFGRNNLKSTTWTIRFDCEESLKGQAVLRLAFCGSHTGCHVEVLVNGESVGDTGPLPSTSAMQREGVRAYWVEKRVSFDASCLRKGSNKIGLLSHADSWAQGVLYDYLRLEFQEP